MIAGKNENPPPETWSRNEAANVFYLFVNGFRFYFILKMDLVTDITASVSHNSVRPEQSS